MRTRHSAALRALPRGPTSALVLSLSLSLAAACVTPPSPEEVLAAGFRTPEQAFRTFQTAIRMDSPDLELRCFSSGFRARNHVSQLTWREAREELYERMPWLRAGIAGADVLPRARHDGAAELEVRPGGRRLRVVLVREDFADLWAGGERLLDEEIDWASATGVQQGAGASRWIFGRAALPSDIDPATISEIRFGREWKIDSVEPLDDTGSEPPRHEDVSPPSQASPHPQG